MKILWTLLGSNEPPANPSRRLKYAKALERLLLTSSSGAFFFALARSVPQHAREFSLSPDWPYTLDRVLRYLCFTWFLAYFFVSSVHKDDSPAPRGFRDIGFVVVQSISVLAAAYGLGFVVPDRGLRFNDGLSAFLFSNAVVALICVLSLGLFPAETPR